MQNYQELAMRTNADQEVILQRLISYGPSVLQITYGLIGLVNEVGEIADIVKASVEYGKGPMDPVHLKEEVGDCLWRLAQICDAANINLLDCMVANIEKLSNRYPDKFTEHNANNRDLAAERKALEQAPTVAESNGKP